MNCPKKVIVTYHYNEDDIDCSGDYCEVDIKFDKNIVFTAGDYYHDKGCKQVEGFLEACKLIWGADFPKAKKENKNDFEC